MASIHEVEEVKRHDTHRERHLKELGLTVLRFKNADVLNDTNGVLRTIEHAIEELSGSLLGTGKNARQMKLTRK